MAKEELQQKWQKLAGQFSTDQSLISEFWHELERAYNHKKRHYHTFLHLQQMFGLLREYQSPVKDPVAFGFAIFYHDAVYSASRSDNEEKSATLAAKRLKTLGLPPARINQVTQLILATKTHQPQADPDGNTLLDLDLNILGAEWPEYLAYTQQIRQEYSLYPDFLYNPGRKKVLHHFLGQEQMYKTEPFRILWETKARENLIREIELLA